MVGSNNEYNKYNENNENCMALHDMREMDDE